MAHASISAFSSPDVLNQMEILVQNQSQIQNLKLFW